MIRPATQAASISDPIGLRTDCCFQHTTPWRAVSLDSVQVLIPALNEEQSLPLVLRDLPAVGRVIVVDNGSTDATAKVAANAGAEVVYEPSRGYGSACLRGVAELEQGRAVPKVVCFVDADYSDHPQLLCGLVEPILANEADFVLGSRLLGQRERGAMPPQSVYRNQLACRLMQILFRVPYPGIFFFDLVVTWLEFAPWFLLLIAESVKSRESRARAEKTETS